MARGGIDRKGQGLPLTVIVIAAISIIVLVLIVAFSTGAFGKLFGSTKTFIDVASPEEISTFRLGCEQACFSAKQLANTVAKFENSGYCERKLVNKTETGTENIHCWQSTVVVDCEYTIVLPEGEKTCKGTGMIGAESCTCA